MTETQGCDYQLSPWGSPSRLCGLRAVAEAVIDDDELFHYCKKHLKVARPALERQNNPIRVYDSVDSGASASS